MRSRDESLNDYRHKRNFRRTPEPAGTAAQRRPAAGEALTFVVQKHAASHLHYDFRLELGGVLKSWAIPKSPSLDPADRRLAAQVEDHPLAYGSFQGTIPAGNYGAGEVVLWDAGTYRPLGLSRAASRAAQEKILASELAAGHLRFTLNGDKLRGAFSLIRTARKEGASNAKPMWLLLKKDDADAATGDSWAVVETADTSGKRRQHAWAAGRRTAAPQVLRPMLATLVAAAFDSPEWIFEPKWDGYRAVASLRAGALVLQSRTGLDLSQVYPQISRDLRQLAAASGKDCLLDGEIVVLDADGNADFQALQHYQSSRRGDVYFMIFDLIELGGKDYRRTPLQQRKETLRRLLKGAPAHLRFSDYVTERGTAFYREAVAAGCEGMVAKRASSIYQDGQRSLDWCKVKALQSQEAVVCGFTEPKGQRRGLGSLILGVYNQTGGIDHLEFIGRASGRLDDAALMALRAKLDKLVVSRCPFPKRPALPGAAVHWTKPELVVQVRFSNWTEAGRMRHPVVVGQRLDKVPAEVWREEAAPADQRSGATAAKASGTKGSPLPPSPASTGSRASRTSRSSRSLRSSRSAASSGSSASAGSSGSPGPSSSPVGSAPSAAVPLPTLTHPDKVYWPREGYTKADVLAHYRAVAPQLLLYLRDRPENLHRFPGGIDAPAFYQKHVEGALAAEYPTVVIPGAHSGKEARYILCQDEPTLAQLVNLGCLELHPWSSRQQSLHHPDFLIIDLDPEALPFSAVVEVATAYRLLLEELELVSFLKTSGQRGLHILLPLGAAYTYEQCRQLAELMSRLLHSRLPQLTSLVRDPRQRQRRVYLDYLRNGFGQTIVAPYSLRPVATAPVSTPLRWSELNRRLDPGRYTLKTIARRLNKVGDLWEPLKAAPGLDMTAVLGRLTALFAAEKKV